MTENPQLPEAAKLAIAAAALAQDASVSICERYLTLAVLVGHLQRELHELALATLSKAEARPKQRRRLRRR